MDWAALGLFIEEVGPLILEILNAYNEGKLQGYKDELLNAKSDEERKAVRERFANRLYDK